MKKIYALVPSEREKECINHLYSWTGSIPCTGLYKCSMCGHEKQNKKGKKNMKSISTPWGMSQTLKVKGGIVQVDTSSHGGIGLAPVLMKKIPDEIINSDFFNRWIMFQDGYFWFEEDCMASIPCYFFYDELKEDYWKWSKSDFLKDIQRYIPEFKGVKA